MGFHIRLRAVILPDTLPRQVVWTIVLIIVMHVTQIFWEMGGEWGYQNVSRQPQSGLGDRNGDSDEMTPAPLWLILCSAVLASGARLPAGVELYPARQSSGLPEELVQENQRRDLNSSHGSGPTRGTERDEAAGDQLEMNSHGPSPLVDAVTEATMRGDSSDNTLDEGDGTEEYNFYADYGDDGEEYYDYEGYNVDGDRYEKYFYYDHADYYDDGDNNNNGDDDDGEDNENELYWHGSEPLQSQITNCSDIGGGFQLCFQNQVEDTGKSGERVHQEGDDTDRLGEDTFWDLRNSDDEVKDDDHVDDDDDDDNDSDGMTNGGKKEETDENNILHLADSFPVLVSDDRLEPDLYFLDSTPAIVRADQINDESIVHKEPNKENESFIATASQEQGSGPQNKWFEHDTKDSGTANRNSESITQTLPDQDSNFTISDHKTPFEEVYDLVMHSRLVNDVDKHFITSLERLRRHVSRLGGLETLHSKSLVHHIVKRQLSGTEACAMFKRRRRRAAVEVAGMERGSRSRRGIGNVGRSLEQGNPRVRQLVNQYKAMCDFISLSVFEK